MTQDHERYFGAGFTGHPADKPPRDFCAVTEHRLSAGVFNSDRHFDPSMRFFRVPSEPTGVHGLPEIALTDVQEGDTILVIGIRGGHLYMFRLLYVTKIEDRECFYVLMNDFLDYGQDLIDRFAGLLGRVPTE